MAAKVIAMKTIKEFLTFLCHNISMATVRLGNKEESVQ
jgi:hypothetical protein